MTLARDERLKELWADEVSTAAIAKELGCSTSAVKRARLRLNLPKRRFIRRKLDESERNILKARWKDGVVIKLIAAELECAISTVRLTRITMGLPPRNLSCERGVPTVHVRLPPNLYAALTKRSFVVGSTVSEYVRKLLRRDLGVAPE